MTAHLVDTLTGALLDAAVAKAEGHAEIELEPRCQVVLPGDDGQTYWTDYSPSTSSEEWGRLVDEWRLSVGPKLVCGDWLGDWKATAFAWRDEGLEHAHAEDKELGIAICRAIVGSKFGETVEL